MSSPTIDLSIVSHGQMGYVELLLHDLKAHVRVINKIYLVKNISEPDPVCISEFSNLIVIENEYRKGFGANHNYVASLSNATYLGIVNPDIRLGDFSFSEAVKAFETENALIVAPAVENLSGAQEDSARAFPSLFQIMLKLCGVRHVGKVVLPERSTIAVDWAAGMFWITKLKGFKDLGGFDERYFMYYEDVDFCARAKLAGRLVLCLPRLRVIHQAQRRSHRSLKYLSWHVLSLVRYFSTYGLTGPCRKR